MGLVEGNLYLVKKDKDWIVAMFAGFTEGRSRGMDWRWAKFIGPSGLFSIPASDTSLDYREIPDTD
tara:strand:- start:299 stop:496 length:198 start_codon:yes stop_codon:yes gene_type:complete